MAEVAGDKDGKGAIEGKVQQGQQHEEQEPEEGLCSQDIICQLYRLAWGIKSAGLAHLAQKESQTQAVKLRVKAFEIII